MNFRASCQFRFSTLQFSTAGPLKKVESFRIPCVAVTIGVPKKEETSALEPSKLAETKLWLYQLLEVGRVLESGYNAFCC